MVSFASPYGKNTRTLTVSCDNMLLWRLVCCLVICIIGLWYMSSKQNKECLVACNLQCKHYLNLYICLCVAYLVTVGSVYIMHTLLFVCCSISVCLLLPSPSVHNSHKTYNNTSVSFLTQRHLVFILEWQKVACF